jgi:hypothetical protein
MQTVVTTPRHIAEDTLSQLRVTEIIQTPCEAFKLRISAHIKANSLALLTKIQKLKNQSTRLDQQLSIPGVANIAAEGGMAALAPPLDSLNDDHDQPASHVVDFTPFSEVTFFEPFKNWPDAIATRSVFLLKPPLHGDSFRDNTTAHTAVTVHGVRQSTTTPLARVTPFFRVDTNITLLHG